MMRGGREERKGRNGKDRKEKKEKKEKGKERVERTEEKGEGEIKKNRNEKHLMIVKVTEVLPCQF